MKFIFALLSIILVAFPAQAYIGPGVGLGTIGVVLGLVVSMLTAIVAVIWYPLKRILGIKPKKKKRKE